MSRFKHSKKTKAAARLAKALEKLSLIKNRVISVFSIDLRTLALLRICLGTVILIDLLDRSKDLIAHYSSKGIIPTELLLNQYIKPGSLSIHLLSRDPIFQAALFAIAAILAAMLIIGLHTKFATIASLAMLISLHQSNPIVLIGGDIVMVHALFWSIFLPIGARFSIDSKNKKTKETNKFFSLAIIGLYTEIACMYIFSAVWKIKSGIWIPAGEGVYHALTYNIYMRPLTKYLLMQPELMKMLSYGVIALEILGPIILLSPFFIKRTRIAIVALFAGMHIGFLAFLNIGTFALTNIAAITSFIPDYFWNKMNRKEKSQKKLRKENLPQKQIIAFNAFCIIFIALIPLLNLQSIGMISLPKETKPIINMLELDQQWNLYSTAIAQKKNITTHAFWSGTLANGTRVYKTFYGDSFLASRQKLQDIQYTNGRWGKLSTITENPKTRHFFARHLCQKWNSEHRAEERLEFLQIETAQVFLNSHYEKELASRYRTAWRYNCR